MRAELALTLTNQQRALRWLQGLELFGSTYWERVPRREAEAPLTCFLNAVEAWALTICARLAPWTHRVAQLRFEIADLLERHAVILVDGPKVGVRRKDVHPGRKPAQVAARRS